MPSEEQTKADLLTLIQGRNQRIAELELLVLDLNRQVEESRNALSYNEKKVFGEKNEKEKEDNEKKEEKINGK
jgi:hypothetical protein